MGLVPTRRPAMLWLTLVFLATGCDAATETFAPVQGKVSYKGVPLRNGTIVFVPDVTKGSTGPLARADIQSDGTYRLQSDGQLGAMVGWHRVTIVALDQVPNTTSNRGFTVPRSLLPDKYRDPELSGLTCEVKAARQNVFNFDLN